jgi:hypothetical protein
METPVPSRDWGSLPSLKQKLRQRRSVSWRGKDGLTLSHKVPPRCVQRVIRAPPSDTRTIGRASVVLVYIRGTRGCLPVKPGE